MSQAFKEAVQRLKIAKRRNANTRNNRFGAPSQPQPTFLTDYAPYSKRKKKRANSTNKAHA